MLLEDELLPKKYRSSSGCRCRGSTSSAGSAPPPHAPRQARQVSSVLQKRAAPLHWKNFGEIRATRLEILWSNQIQYAPLQRQKRSTGERTVPVVQPSCADHDRVPEKSRGAGVSLISGIDNILSISSTE